MAGDEAELDKKDPGGVDGPSEGVPGFEVAEVLPVEDLGCSVPGLVQAEVRQLKGDLERSPGRPLVEEGHGYRGEAALDWKDGPTVDINILT